MTTDQPTPTSSLEAAWSAYRDDLDRLGTWHDSAWASRERAMRAPVESAIRAEVIREVEAVVAGLLAATPPLPCRVDEMTEREVAIYKVAADRAGALAFLADHLRALSQWGEVKSDG